MIRFLTAAACAGALGLSAAGALADPPASTPASPPTQAPAPGPAPQAAAPVDKDNEVVCFREEETGSRLGGHKICMTRAQRAQRAREAQQMLDDTRGRLGPAPQ